MRRRRDIDSGRSDAKVYSAFLLPQADEEYWAQTHRERPPHHKRLIQRKQTTQSKKFSVVTAVATADSYKFAELRRYFQPQRNDDEFSEIGVVYLHFPAYGGEKETWIFFFFYGVTVWWGSDRVGKQVLAQLKPFEVKRERVVDFETADWSYNSNTPLPECLPDIGGKSPRIHLDHFYLENDSVLLKMAFSHALAQSAKLSVFEDRIEQVISVAQKYPDILSRHGSVSLSKVEAAKLKGMLFLQRMNINLHSDILDTPEFFWEHTMMKPVYYETRQYMDIDQRVEVLNQRLQIVDELFYVLHQEQNTKHLQHLEWIVIGLVFVDISLALLSACHHYGYIF